VICPIDLRKPGSEASIELLEYFNQIIGDAGFLNIANNQYGVIIVK
jgi:hypothetical protein